MLRKLDRYVFREVLMSWVAVTGVRVVAGTGDRGFDVTFAAQTAPGTYSLRIGPEVMDPRNVKMAPYAGSFQVAAPAPAPTPPRITAAAWSEPSRRSSALARPAAA